MVQTREAYVAGKHHRQDELIRGHDSGQTLHFQRFPRSVVEIRVFPATCPRGEVLRRRSDSFHRSHRAWQARFYWVVEKSHQPLDWRACGGYPVVDPSPFGWLLRIGLRSSELRRPTVLTQNSQGFQTVPPFQPTPTASTFVHSSGGSSLDPRRVGRCIWPRGRE